MTIVDVVRILRRNLALLVICTLAGGLLGAVYQLTRSETFTAKATGMVVAGDSTSVGEAMSGNAIAQQRAATYTKLVETRTMAQKTSEILKKHGMPEAANGQVSASVPGDTAFIDIKATGGTAKNAQALANAGLEALISEALRMETYGQIAASDHKSDAQLAKMTSVHVLGYESAGLPSGDRGKSVALYVVAGLAAGFLIGAVVAVVRKQFDVKVRDQATIEELTGSGILSVIPDDKKLAEQREKSIVHISGVTGEAFRHLRTNLRFANVDNPPRAVVVTSANPGEGKSTVSTHLAVVMAQAGEKVVLIDADMRRPVQHKAFGAEAGVGLSQVLAGDVTLDDALMRTETKRLQMLAAGRIPPNPSELLGSQRMKDLLTELRKRGYFVVIDAPPLLAITDAGLLGAIADGTIYVAVVGKTHRDQVSLVAKRLEQVGAPLLGSVLTRVPRKKMGDVLYGYGAANYGYGSYYGDYGKRGYSSYGSEEQESRESIAVVQEAQPAEGLVRVPKKDRADTDTEITPRRAK
ncbi:polysaccharide biosynthesis tyrosine autokinase [Cutibacterium avidum]|uniref:non-specific protein-tyrosine kinase n=1 Tax=Cutibacterium avidum TaxID=33010 RepID=A0A3E2DN22_9ACTN|nr:polysaccharide biosynthesis tyrosine autokinase [Cutibacterium avidum]RFT46782.1 capsular biosynthesis protein [Cutibacterium avidum]TMT55719.1 capsular biosynthesis protein [Cutibacterium avidum]